MAVGKFALIVGASAGIGALTGAGIDPTMKPAPVPEWQSRVEKAYVVTAPVQIFESGPQDLSPSLPRQGPARWTESKPLPFYDDPPYEPLPPIPDRMERGPAGAQATDPHDIALSDGADGRAEKQDTPVSACNRERDDPLTSNCLIRAGMAAGVQIADDSESSPDLTFHPVDIRQGALAAD